MKELKQARIILANIEPQIDYIIEQGQLLSENYKLLQELYLLLLTKYDEAIKQIEGLNKQLKENDKHDTNNLES